MGRNSVSAMFFFTRQGTSAQALPLVAYLYSHSPLRYDWEMTEPTSEFSQSETHGLTEYTPHISVRAAGRLWRLSRAADLEQLWDAMTASPDDFDDERLPYWTELWPSSVALAGWLAQQRQ